MDFDFAASLALAIFWTFVDHHPQFILIVPSIAEQNPSAPKPLKYKHMAMENLSNKKRTHEDCNKNETSSHTNSKRQKLGRDHVHTTQVQSVHEASATSNAPVLENDWSPSPRTNVAIPSSRPKFFAKNNLHVPNSQRIRTREPHQTRVKPTNLPPLPLIADANLERAVFTHPVCLSGHNQEKLGKSYDRLEFLGDAYIELIATRLVYSRYPHMPAGRLSQQRENLVKNESLADFSVAYGFENRAQLPPRVSKDSRAAFHNRLNDPQKQYVKMLGDVFEAYVAGIALSNGLNGYQIVEEWLHKLWIPKLEAQNSAEFNEPPAADSKQQLAKRVLGNGARLEYRETDRPDLSESASGKTWFTVGAFLTGWGYDEKKLGEGRALSKSIAGRIAATKALENPATKEIENVKTEHDQKVAEEKAAQTLEDRPEEHHDSTGIMLPSRYSSLVKKPEDQRGEASEESDHSDDSDDSGDSENS